MLLQYEEALYPEKENATATVVFDHTGNVLFTLTVRYCDAHELYDLCHSMVQYLFRCDVHKTSEGFRVVA